MIEVKAYKSELDGGIFETEHDAREADFRAMMRDAFRPMPSLESFPANSIAPWLAGVLLATNGKISLSKLIAALQYLDSNYSIITSSDKESFDSDAAHS